MLNKLTAFIRQYDMIAPDDQVVCAVSGGADSVALLFGLYLLKDKMDFSLSAAHFNHHLRGEESDRDARFVQDFCARYEIPLHMGGYPVQPGPKGLEAAAREARYGFLRSLPGKIATAHTADDNAETILLHLVRGTGMKGLCGITPVSDGLIRPLLTVTRSEVESFLEEYYLPHISDSSNDTDQFLRNRLRHHVMPLLRQENPRLAENMTAMALQLRKEEALLERLTAAEYTLQVSRLRRMEPALRSRVLECFLKESGVPEPERSQIGLAERLVFSDKPSARGQFAGGVTLERCYDSLRVVPQNSTAEALVLDGCGDYRWADWRIRVEEGNAPVNTANIFAVAPKGKVCLRQRRAGDEMRLHGGTKSLKKLFIDRKIPVSQRMRIPVLADEQGVLGVPGIGVNLDRVTDDGPVLRFVFEKE